MSKSRLPILLTICCGCFGWFASPSLEMVHLYQQSSALAQTSESEANPLPTQNSSQSKYALLMKSGNDSLAQKDFPAARNFFSQALAEKPGDEAAQKALAQAQAGDTAAPNNPGGLNEDLSKQILLILGVGLLSAVILGTLVPLLLKQFLGDLKVSKPKRSQGQSQSTSPSQDFSAGEGFGDNGFPFASDEEDEQDWNPALPVQKTTRLPNLDLVLQLIGDLRDPQPRVRRRAIWKLAQISDSRSMQSLVDTMIDTDSYDRSLILEALSQICIRTLRPMNQALAISLQDKNPQVRKNALRDLTRMYNVMAQISQLVAHATEDPDAEVQETAKWAMKQLNLPVPIKLDIPETVVDESEASEEASYTESAELET